MWKAVFEDLNDVEGLMNGSKLLYDSRKITRFHLTSGCYFISFPIKRRPSAFPSMFAKHLLGVTWTPSNQEEMDAAAKSEVKGCPTRKGKRGIGGAEESQAAGRPTSRGGEEQKKMRTPGTSHAQIAGSEPAAARLEGLAQTPHEQLEAAQCMIAVHEGSSARTTTAALQAGLDAARETADALQTSLDAARETAVALQTSLDAARKTADALQTSLDATHTKTERLRREAVALSADVSRKDDQGARIDEL